MGKCFENTSLSVKTTHNFASRSEVTLGFFQSFVHHMFSIMKQTKNQMTLRKLRILEA